MVPRSSHSEMSMMHGEQTNMTDCVYGLCSRIVFTDCVYGTFPPPSVSTPSPPPEFSRNVLSGGSGAARA